MLTEYKASNGKTYQIEYTCFDDMVNQITNIEDSVNSMRIGDWIMSNASCLHKYDYLHK